MRAVNPSSGNSELVRSYYRVKSGDTLAAIARTFNTTVAAINVGTTSPNHDSSRRAPHHIHCPEPTRYSVSYQPSAISRQLSASVSQSASQTGSGAFALRRPLKGALSPIELWAES